MKNTTRSVVDSDQLKRHRSICLQPIEALHCVKLDRVIPREYISELCRIEEETSYGILVADLLIVSFLISNFLGNAKENEKSSK